MTDMLYGAAGGDVVDDHANDFYGAAAGGAGLSNVAGFLPNSAGIVGAGIYNNSGLPPRPRYPGLYVGNLTWWTTDRDVIDAINSIGVNDVQEVKFFENRNNGQSKGFCVVTFTSDTSLSIVMEKLPQRELHGQNPIVTPYNRQNLSIFESQNNKGIRPQMNPTNGNPLHPSGLMGINPMGGVHPAAAVATNPGQLATAVANIPYANVATAGGAGQVSLGYNQPALTLNSLGPASGAVGPQPRPQFMGMRMRAPRPMMSGGMSNGPMMSGGHQMNRMGFIPRPRWNNTQGIGGGGYQGANRMGPTTNMDIQNRQSGYGGSAGLGKHDDMGGSDLQGGSSSYYNSHNSNSQSDHYSSRSDIRDHRDHHHRDLRDDRDIRRGPDDRPSRIDDRVSRLDDRSSRLDERSSRLDERSSRHDDRLSSRDRDRSSRLVDDRSDRSRRSPVDLHRSSSRKFADDDRGGSSRRAGVSGSEDRRDRDRDDRSLRKEEKSSVSSSSRHHRERSHRSDDRGRSRSRSKDRSIRAEASKGSERRDRDRDSRKERY